MIICYPTGTKHTNPTSSATPARRLGNRSRKKWTLGNRRLVRNRRLLRFFLITGCGGEEGWVVDLVRGCEVPGVCGGRGHNCTALAQRWRSPERCETKSENMQRYKVRANVLAIANTNDVSHTCMDHSVWGWRGAGGRSRQRV